MDNYRKYFIQSIKANYQNDFNNILADMDNHYKLISPDTSFTKTSRNPIDRRLDSAPIFWQL